MEGSSEAKTIQLRILVTWMCYLSFFRGFASFFAGYVVNIIPISVSFFVILIPPLVIILPERFDTSRYVFGALLMWMSGILTNHITFKLIFLMVGTSFTFLAMRYDFKQYSVENLTLLPFIFGIDLLLRSSNAGQDFFVHSILIPKLIGVAIVISISYVFYHINPAVDEAGQNSSTTINKDQLGYTLTFFVIIAIYSVELAGSGILVMNNLTNQPWSITITVLAFLLHSYLSLKLNHVVNYKHGFLAGLGLGVSIYFYPWYGISIVFWLLAISLTQILFQLNLKHFRIINQTERSKYILLGHYTLIIIMFVGLLTESYLLMPLISVLVGVVFIVNKNSSAGKSMKFNINFSGLQNKIITFGILLLFISPFIPMNSNINQLESTNNIRVMTYNLHFGISGEGVDNGVGIINVIKKVNPTIIAFQEVTFAAPINGYKDMYSFLLSELEPLGYKNSYFSEGGKYQTRNVIFSKLEMSDSKTTIISPTVIYQRNLLETKITVEKFELMIYATHLTHVIEKESNPDRVDQAKYVMDIISAKTQSLPVILLGDFNSEPDWEEINEITIDLNDTWSENNDGSDGYTWPNNKPRQRIDYIFHNSLIDGDSCWLVNSSASDHLPLVCDFNYP